MKKTILLVIIVGMLGWAVYDFIASANDDDITVLDGEEGTMIISPSPDQGEDVEQAEDVGLEKGEIAPDFELQTLDGETVRLSDYRGQRVMVNFWATWCPPCRAEMPDMQQFYEEKDVAVLAVNLTSTETSIEDVREFIEEMGLTFPILMDDEGELAASYQIQAYPTSYMIDSNGRTSFIAQGPMNEEQMVQQWENMD
ncbi:TlpA disulfide reductase family protein [Aquibacillus sediminis]|uniref:TlpA disulfide reductase family protein n=1 Tax=Aquibacillus sediminis TaxID=2574734 RepID=UPI0011087D48|nr:TlpA disulfide reductase family protein [Aquibacillus sediminis]